MIPLERGVFGLKIRGQQRWHYDDALADACHILLAAKMIIWVQFNQRSTRSFCANSLAPVKYKPKT
jgi:hypothetical protein